MLKWRAPIYVFVILALSLLVVPMVSATLINPTSNWKFNENRGNATDSIGSIKLHQNGGVVSGYIPGKLSNALHLNVSSGEVIMNASGNTLFAFGTGNFSIVYWINGSVPASGSHTAMGTANSAGSWAIISDTAGAEHEWQEGSGRVLGTVSSLTDSLWHRVVWVREGTESNKFKVYVDNVNVQNATLATDITDTTNPFSIHAPNIAPVSYDDLRIYKGYALTVAEISTDWNSGSGQELEGPVLISPSTGSTITNASVILNSSLTAFAGNLTNTTFNIWYVNGTLFNKTTLLTNGTRNNSIFNLSTLIPGNFKWNVYSCSSNTSTTQCGVAASNFTFDYGVSSISSLLTTPIYETEQGAFNVSFNVSSGTTPTANLWWNGTKYAGTGTSLGSNSWRFASAVTIGIGNSTKNLFWEIINGFLDHNTTVSTQGVNLLNVSLCGQPHSTAFLNFTFKDESTLNAIDAQVDASTWEYWIGDGTVTKTTSFANTATTNTSYDFCFSAPDRTVNLDLSFKYSNTSYPQRTFSYDDQALTNASTNQVLYLLGSADGIYSTFQATENSGTPISGVEVTIERQISAVWTIIGKSTTGSDGGVTFWVNPNFNHRLTSVKSGYVTSQVTITPSQTLYTLVMSKTTGSADFNSSLEGMSWRTSPSSGYLAPGSHNFAFNLTANLNNLDGSFCKFELVNSSDTIVASTTGGNSSECNLGITYTHLAGERIFGKLYVDTTDTTGFIIIDADQRWSDIEGTSTTPWRSVYGFFTELKDLDEWGTGGHRQEWNRTVSFFLALTIGVGVFSFFTQWDTQYPGAAILMIFVIIMFASFSGWFNLELNVLDNQGFDKFGKYIVAFVTSLLTFAWYIGYLRRAS